MNRSSFLWPLSVAAVALQFCFVAVYLGHERAIHFWDYAMYANMALQAWGQPTIAASWAAFTQSFSQNYNLLYALPSFFTFSFFGASRDAFVLTNFIAFFVAHEIACGFVLMRLFNTKPRTALFASLGMAPLAPFMWYPLLEGYPDNGGAALLVASIAFLITSSRRWSQGLLAGLALGIAIVFRRHYAYPAFATVLAFGLHDLWLFMRNGAETKSAFLRRSVFFYGACGIATLAVIVGAEPAYFQEMVSTDFISLYKSYERPSLYFILFALSRMGLVLLIAALAGYVLWYKDKTAQKDRVLLMPLMTLVWLIVWTLGPSQAGEHYLISLLPLFCLAGLFGLFMELRRFRFGRAASVFALGALVFNAAYALWFSPSFVLPSEAPRLSLLSVPRTPWVRKDFDELRSLASYLAQTTTDTDKIAIVGSSFIFNQDLVRALYTDILKNIRPAYRFIPAPETDGQQSPPIQPLSLANVYVVGVPTQYHLDPQGQKVITSFASQFPPPSDTKTFFKKDERIFHLDRGVEVHIWRRSEWAPADLLSAADRMRAFGGDADEWSALHTNGALRFDQRAGQTGKSLLLLHPAEEGETVLLYGKPLSAGQVHIEAKEPQVQGCSSLSLLARIKTEQGKTLSEKTLRFDQGTSTYFTDVYLGDNEEKKYLYIVLQTTSQNVCSVSLGQLTMLHKK